MHYYLVIPPGCRGSSYSESIITDPRLSMIEPSKFHTLLGKRPVFGACLKRTKLGLKLCEARDQIPGSGSLKRTKLGLKLCVAAPGVSGRDGLKRTKLGL